MKIKICDWQRLQCILRLPESKQHAYPFLSDIALHWTQLALKCPHKNFVVPTVKFSNFTNIDCVPIWLLWVFKIAQHSICIDKTHLTLSTFEEPFAPTSRNWWKENEIMTVLQNFLEKQKKRKGIIFFSTWRSFYHVSQFRDNNIAIPLNTTILPSQYAITWN